MRSVHHPADCIGHIGTSAPRGKDAGVVATKWRRAALEQRWEDQKGYCAQCSCAMLSIEETRLIPFHAVAATLDHYIPRSRGGSDTMENVRACCYTCNNQKANTMPEEHKQPEARLVWNSGETRIIYGDNNVAAPASNYDDLVEF